MDKNKIYISISDNRGKGGSGTSTPVREDVIEKQEDENLILSYAGHKLFDLTKQQVEKAIDYSLSNIGNFTGDYIAQRKVNEMKSFISGVARIGASTWAGLSVGGGAGAVVGFVVGAVSTVSSAIYSDKTNRIENQKINYSIEQLRQRAGMNSLIDESRGTLN